jgi:cell cycle arrest protein BUB2
MNTICGPFLYVMPEVDAFFAFSKLVTKKFPLYWVCSHIGVQAGALLVDQCIRVIDRPLADHLEKHNLSAYIYAFHCISSLCASIPPFGELLKLWDFLLAFGPHFNVRILTHSYIGDDLHTNPLRETNGYHISFV